MSRTHGKSAHPVCNTLNAASARRREQPRSAAKNPNPGTSAVTDAGPPTTAEVELPLRRRISSEHPCSALPAAGVGAYIHRAVGGRLNSSAATSSVLIFHESAVGTDPASSASCVTHLSVESAGTAATAATGSPGSGSRYCSCSASASKSPS